jgi:DNA-binding GntR family transcriptional regulator
MPVLGTTSLERTSLRDQALTAIKQALITGQIVPGVVYSAASLAAELGVSNSPVREAMLALVDDGLMEAVPNRGYRPVSLTDADLAEIAQVRELLEVPAAGLAAEIGLGGRFAELSELAGLIEQSAAAGDLAANLAADRRFHLVLVGACGNRRLTEMVARLRDQTRLYNLPALAASGALIASAAEHGPILDAIAAGDRARAEALMRAHLAHITTDWSAGSEDNDAERELGSRGGADSEPA